MNRKQTLLNEITKLVKIKLLQEASTPPEIDDILDKLNQLGGDKSKLSKTDLYTLDYYSEHGAVPNMQEDEEDVHLKRLARSFDRQLTTAMINDVIVILNKYKTSSRLSNLSSSAKETLLLSDIHTHLFENYIGIELDMIDSSPVKKMIQEWIAEEMSSGECAQSIVLYIKKIF